nr:ORF3 [Yichang virus]
MHKIAIIVAVSVAMVGYIYPTDATTAASTNIFCDAAQTQHCSAAGFSRCKRVGTVQNCYCPHSQNWTNVVTVVEEDLTCAITSSKYLDPHYWFQDLLAAHIIITVLVSVVLFVYLIPIYAKVCAMYKVTAKGQPLHYIPLLPHNDRTGYNIIPTKFTKNGR